MLITSMLLLFYTALTVPVQICMWNYDDPCNMFPTLYFDVFVDSFFLVIHSFAVFLVIHSFAGYTFISALTVATSSSTPSSWLYIRLQSSNV